MKKKNVHAYTAGEFSGFTLHKLTECLSGNLNLKRFLLEIEINNSLVAFTTCHLRLIYHVRFELLQSETKTKLQIYIQRDRQTDKQARRQTSRQAEKQTDRESADGQTKGRSTDRQTAVRLIDCAGRQNQIFLLHPGTNIPKRKNPSYRTKKAQRNHWNLLIPYNIELKMTPEKIKLYLLKKLSNKKRQCCSLDRDCFGLNCKWRGKGTLNFL